MSPGRLRFIFLSFPGVVPQGLAQVFRLFGFEGAVTQLRFFDKGRGEGKRRAVDGCQGGIA
jgi:hypothetical protein